MNPNHQNKLTPEINTGLIIEIREEDYLFGGFTQIAHEERNSIGDWSQFLPTEERQSGRFFDTFGCVTFSGLNSVETQIQWAIANKLLTADTMQFLNDNGYLDENGRPNFSDRFTAKMSHTIPGRGNSFQAVWDSIRNDGLVPEKAWPNDLTDLNVTAYYSEIPQAVKDLGKQFLEHFSAGYERVNQKDIPEAIKHAPIQVGTATCSTWAGGVIPMCSAAPNHGTMLYKVDAYYHDFDTYEPFEKKLAKNYSIPYAFKCVISPIQSIGDNKVQPSGSTQNWFQKLLDFIFSK